MSQDWYGDVAEFHAKFGCYTQPTPEHPPLDVRVLRERLMLEELGETTHAMHTNDLIGVADGLADLIYVALGCALAYGIDLRPVWDEVQKTNMAKVGGPQRPDGKILKPEGWVPPDVAGILRSQRYPEAA